MAPSPDTNNRYLKATLLPAEVRLSFTIFLGERPGALERRRLDTSGDGVLDEAEARVLGERLRAQLAPGLAVTLDGEPLAGWTVADVGLGQPSVRGGALSVDLVLAARYPHPEAAEHTLVLDDHTTISQPGESETRVEESPGVRVTTCTLPGAGGGIELRFPFTGDAAAPGERAVAARFAVDAELRAPAPAARPRWLWPAALGVAVLCLALGLAYRKRPYRKV